MNAKSITLLCMLLIAAFLEIKGQDEMYLNDSYSPISKLDSIRSVVKTNLISATRTITCGSRLSDIYGFNLLEVEEGQDSILIKGESSYSCKALSPDFVKFRFRTKLVYIFGGYEIVEMDFDNDLNGSYEEQVVPVRLSQKK